MTRAELETWLAARGYEKDRWGHYQRAAGVHSVSPGTEYRWRMGKLSARREVRVRHDDGSADWVRLQSGYYAALSLTEEGKVRGMKR